MKVCLIAVEIFAWGKYGGFGRATRIIGRELAARGVEVSAVVPRRQDQRPVEDLDGIRVLGFPMNRPLAALDLLRQADADIYHTEEPSLGTYLAQRAMPGRVHVVTFRDPRDASDWRTEFRLPSLSPAQVISNWLYEDNFLVGRAVRNANARFVAARLLVPKVRRKYRLQEDPPLLPTPVSVPTAVEKADQPTVCFLARWDRRKRPEIFFELASRFPQVRFLAAGKSRDEAYDRALRQKYSGLPNLEMLGFIDQFRGDALSRLLGQSWILVNTAAREGLPNAFIEAAAHRCAILSAVDPDGFASDYGYHVQEFAASADNRPAQDGVEQRVIDQFVVGLETLLKDNCWRSKGEAGYDYVSRVYALDRAIEQHLQVYQDLLS